MNKEGRQNLIGKPQDPITNSSDNVDFATLLNARLNRRQILKGGLGAATAGFLGGAGALALTGCDSSSSSTPVSGSGGVSLVTALGFTAIALNQDDTATVPAGYTATPFIPWGTPITGSYPAYLDGGLNTGAEQEQQVGMHHDGMHFFPIDNRSDEGLLVVNHEYIQQNTMHASGAATVDGSGNRTVEDEVRKEIAAHGVSVVHIKKDAGGNWGVVPSMYNRRITGATPMAIRGAVRGSDFVITKYSPAGTMTRGTLNNCAHGYTPWNTYLTCEENWAGYFVNKDATLPREHSRYGVATGTGRYKWETLTSGGDQYVRFNATTLGADATEDYRNEPNAFGWVVEIDPFDPDATPIKRTALGRIAHEGAWFAPAQEGKPVVVYMGDDARNEYIYKFVSKNNYHKATANGSLLDEGTLYVAKFNADGGEWLALEYGQNGLTDANGFTSQADVLVNTRLAADFVGATKMDRPEWGTVNPFNGEIYFTLTNNSNRTSGEVDDANPRGPNPYGHIIKIAETGNNPAATGFAWDIFVLAGTAGDSLDPNGNPLTADNTFASPDGLWVDDGGVMWIQTDMSGSQLNGGTFGNNQMLGAIPSTGDIRRFFVGPIGCEVTGVVMTPDRKTMFVNVQHPGEQGNVLLGNGSYSEWPDGSGARPRSSTVIITRDDGGVIGV